jgi:TPR repeat protein
MKRSAGVTKVKIFKYLALSALLAMSVSGATAQNYNKGVSAYESGDYRTALKEFLPLAENGDANAQAFIGLMHDDGAGVIQSDVEAVKWYRLAADQGNAAGQNNLGTKYDTGRGIMKNDAEAVKLYSLAAYQGYALGQRNLALMYQNGEGIIQNNVIAHMWFNIASANGYEVAAKERDAIAVKMTREEIAKAQAMAQECISSGYENCGD